MNATQKDHENHLSDKESKWFAVHTRFKSEKMALKYLSSNDVTAYLPLKNLSRKYGNRIRVIEMPLISSCVFVKIKKSEYIKVLETPYTAGFFKIGKNLLSVKDKEIELIQKLIGENIEVEVERKEFLSGDMVEISAGPLMGLQGKLITLNGKQKVAVELINSEFYLKISIELSLLKKIG